MVADHPSAFIGRLRRWSLLTRDKKIHVYFAKPAASENWFIFLPLWHSSSICLAFPACPAASIHRTTSDDHDGVFMLDVGGKSAKENIEPFSGPFTWRIENQGFPTMLMNLAKITWSYKLEINIV